MLKVINKIAAPIIEKLPENNRLERIWALAKVDFKKRYYDNALGMVWALLNPILRLAVYTLAFAFIRNSPFENFHIYLFSALLCWMFFSELTNKSIKALKSKRYLLENVQFNWLDIFYSLTISTVLGFLFNLVAYFVMAIISGVYPTLYAFWLPVLVLNVCITGLGFSLILAGSSIYLKDIEHLWGICILAGFWTAPIFFMLEDIQKSYPILLYIHPVTPIMINLRNATFYHQPLDMEFFVWGWLYAILVLIIGFIFFQKSRPYALERM